MFSKHCHILSCHISKGAACSCLKAAYSCLKAAACSCLKAAYSCLKAAACSCLKAAYSCLKAATCSCLKQEPVPVWNQEPVPVPKQQHFIVPKAVFSCPQSSNILLFQKQSFPVLKAATFYCSKSSLPVLKAAVFSCPKAITFSCLQHCNLYIVFMVYSFSVSFPIIHSTVCLSQLFLHFVHLYKIISGENILSWNLLVQVLIAFLSKLK